MHKSKIQLLLLGIKALLCLSFVACTQIQTRRRPARPQPVSTQPGQKAPPATQDSDFPEETQNDFQEPPPEMPTHRKHPRLGIILGAGGARTFAFEGLLKSLEKEKIPVHAVVGLEWGALVGGLYARNGRTHNLEWELYKLRDEDLPGQSWFAKALSKNDIGQMNSYLDKAFADTKLENSKLKFACPTTSTATGRVNWQQKGSFRNVMQTCIPYPPLFVGREGLAAPFRIEEAAQWLRLQGAEIVILVDVLSEGNLWGGSPPSEEAVRLLWWEIQRTYQGPITGVDEIIRVSLASYKIGDFSRRKNISEVGLTAGKSLAKTLIERYGF